MICFSLNDIRKLASDTSFRRGVKYFNNGHVKNASYEHNTIVLQVQGHELYEVILEFSEETGSIVYTECNCPAHGKYYGVCKHIVAGLLYVLYKQEQMEKELLAVTHKQVIDSFTKALIVSNENVPKKIIELDITIAPADINKKTKSTQIQFRIGEKRLYVIKKIRDFIKKVSMGEPYLFGKDFTYNHHLHSFNDTDKKVLHVIEDYFMTEDYFMGQVSSWHQSQQTAHTIALPENYLVQFLNQLENTTFHLNYEERVYRDVEILETIDIPFVVKQKEDVMIVSIDKTPDFFKLVSNGLYIFFGHNIYKLNEEKRKLIDVLLDTFDKHHPQLMIKNSYKNKFVSSVLPVLSAFGTVIMDDSLSKNIYKESMQCDIYLDKYNETIKGTVVFYYGPYKVGLYPPSKPKLPEDLLLVQDIKTESEIQTLIKNAGCVPNEDYSWFTIPSEENLYNFIYHYLPKLQSYATIYYSEAFQNMPIHRSYPIQGEFKLNKKSDMLEFSFSIENIDTSELSNILKSVKEKQRYYKLKNGGLLPLNTHEFNEIGSLIEHLHLSSDDLKKSKILIPKYHAIYIDKVLEDTPIKGVNIDSRLKELVQNIQEPNTLAIVPPKELLPILRDYQKLGYQWLKTLSLYGFGGILADDMGLGKTLQAIALIKSSKNSHPSLVVAPTSLIFNWLDEIEKFAPDLNANVINGNKIEREKALAHTEADVLITSYGLLKRDIEFYEDFTFNYCFIDEAQHIKNPKSLNAKTAKQIHAKTRFALTGTPIENSLTELWSIFDFILPGYLSTHSDFCTLYERPITKHNNHEVLKVLTKKIKPFILRRLKEDVLKELPPKIETKVVTELLTHQKKLYLAYLEQTKNEIKIELSSKGYQKSRIKILSALTRLRQICCHPSLFIDNYEGSSGKLDLLKEIVTDAVESSHRLLVFSQFTSMLKIIQNMLERLNISSFYLDGSTKAETRRTMVHCFNKGEKNCFLISLKAGGTGLNLTGADMVIHYDPWWNPAVEEQATDRAYRIGQDKPVQVIKLITHGTIEEKIYQLQQKKRSMIESVIMPGETLLSNLSEDDIRALLEI